MGLFATIPGEGDRQAPDCCRRSPRHRRFGLQQGGLTVRENNKNAIALYP